MMISKIKFAIKISSLVAVHLLALTVVSNLILAHEQLEQIPKLRDDTHDQLFAGSQQLHHGSIPGHYEFEVAPKMEPPAVRKPPYLQSSQMCPGSDTLCGDLNQGKLPLNPIGQKFSDQSYPFELIKNKTLQFLARALPVLKLEYETIPKVARYLPTNQLLNPTHQASPLSNDHLHQLNQLFASANGFPPESVLQDSPPYLKKRRKRSLKNTKDKVASNVNLANSAGYSSVVADITPNATLVVTSAHSAGQIGHFGQSHLQGTRNGDESRKADEPIDSVVITKDGHKPIGSSPSSSASPSYANSGTTIKQQPQQSFATQRAQTHPYLLRTSSGIMQHSNPHNGLSSSSSSSPIPSQSAPLSSSWSNAADNNNNNSINKSQKLVQTSAPAPAAGQNIGSSNNARSSSERNQISGGDNGQNSNGHSSHSPSDLANTINSQVLHSTASSTTSVSQNHATGANRDKDTRADHSTGNNVDKSVGNGAIGQGRSSGDTEQANTAATSAGPAGEKPKTIALKEASSRVESSKRSGQVCADAGNGFTSAICQLASALIVGERQPNWLHVVKSIGNAYSTASAASSDNMVASTSNPVWSILSSLTQDSATAKSSNGNANGANNNQLTRSSNLMNVLGPIASYITGTTAKDSSTNIENKEHAQSLGSSLTSSMAKLAVAGWASSALTQLAEYLVPSMFSSAARTFAKRKKPFDPLETFVDTPASLSALNAATGGASKQAMSQQSQAGIGFAGKQPPTPCPSVEEYISPTFARNYQGAWKYVVQIPHEGYFTQTIQRTSCVRQRCEFTDGVCHESPRWVSLLVAEIYYPNTIFGQQPAIDQGTGSQSYMSASPSTNNIQQAQQQQHLHSKPTQDPLQMTDTSNTYNHNLNNAFINAANELGWDPNNVANMQNLANSYSYQLMQRNGLTPANVGQVAESRSSQASGVLASSPSASYLPAASYGQQQLVSANQPMLSSSQQQQQQLQYYNSLTNQQLAQLYGNDYIVALAAAALQQNPNLNINDLINSLQIQNKRRKRDVAMQQVQRSRSQFSSPMSPSAPSSLETLPSMNDINSQLPQQVGQNANQYKQPMQALGSQPASSVSAPANDNHLQSMPPGAMPNNLMAGDTNQASNQAGDNNNSNNQVECDGHDKIGCYVVRVYYDWFLVNGSCKCWKTSNGQTGSSTNTGNSFLRRIFTG